MLLTQKLAMHQYQYPEFQKYLYRKNGIVASLAKIKCE